MIYPVLYANGATKPGFFVKIYLQIYFTKGNESDIIDLQET